jgi:hypothetical protein
VDENTASGVVGSLIPSAWGNAVTDELLAVIKAAGLTPDELNNSQLLAAIKSFKGIQRFTFSGVFVVPAGVTTIWVTAVAGGGGGGGTLNIGATGNIAAGGGGGGAGQYTLRQPFTVIPGQVIAITVGVAGAGGGIATAGSPGSATIIGSLVTLSGGSGGGPGGAGSTSQSWAGGPGGAGYPNGGDASDISSGYGAISGAGGSSPLGGGGGGRRSALNQSLLGNPAFAYGAGGGGAGGSYGGTVTSSGNVGGPGSPGYVAIEY